MFENDWQVVLELSSKLLVLFLASIKDKFEIFSESKNKKSLHDSMQNCNVRLLMGLQLKILDKYETTAV